MCMFEPGQTLAAVGAVAPADAAATRQPHALQDHRLLLEGGHARIRLAK
jgi:hypothetical protein